MGTLYGDGPNEQRDADHAAARAARFRRETDTPALAAVERKAGRVGAAVGRVMKAAAERGDLLPGQTADSPNLNEAQRAKHRRCETRTEADMAERYDARKLRLPLGYGRKLDALAESEGQSVSKLVATWIDGAERDLRALR